MNEEQTQLVGRLWDLGFSPFSTKEEAIHDTTPAILYDMIDLYCEHHHISRGQFAAHVTLVRFCKLPDRMVMPATLCKFPTVNVAWAITAGLPGMTSAQQQAVYTQAWQQWQDVSGIRPKQITDGTQANVQMGARRIDGPQGVLAESELPCGVTRVRQWYDTSEAWSAGPGPTNKINLVAVACHELGHALGLDHTNDGGLMDPYYNASVTKPKGQQELAAIQLRYGPPAPDPIPPTVPGGNLPDPLVVTIRGSGQIEIPGYRVVKIT